MLLEARNTLGSETSARNSGVIHSGLYYSTDSNKARLCVEGRHKLYEYLLSRNVNHKKCGKLIVSTSAAEREKLLSIMAQAKKNGLSDRECRLISKEEACFREPSLLCDAALLCAETGVVDVAHLLQMLEADLDEAGVGIARNCEMLGAAWDKRSATFAVETSQGDVRADVVVNAAGLQAPALAHKIHTGMDSYRPPNEVYFAKGTWFRMQMNYSPFNHLIYPVPVDGGLGVHSTVDITGQLRFGPDVEWLSSPGNAKNFAWKMQECSVDNFHVHYAAEESRGDSFYDAIRRYYPTLPDDSLVPDFTGIRPKLVGPGALTVADFRIHEPREHGVPGLVNLLGIESPGLTSSLAIADRVSEILL